MKTEFSKNMTARSFAAVILMFSASTIMADDEHIVYQNKCLGYHANVVDQYMIDSLKLSHLDISYITRQFHCFDEGFRNIDQLSKHQPKMRAAVKILTDDKFEALTHFIASVSLNKDEILDE